MIMANLYSGPPGERLENMFIDFLLVIIIYTGHNFTEGGPDQTYESGYQGYYKRLQLCP